MLSEPPLVIWIRYTRQVRVKLLMPQPAKFAVMLMLWACAPLALSQTPAPTPLSTPASAPKASTEPVQPAFGHITGTIFDQSGALVSGAHITLIHDNQNMQ